MIIDCQLKSLLKNYLKTLIVGFGQADALGLRLIIFTIIIYLRNSLFMYILAMNYDKIMILETEHDVNIVDFLLHCLN
jgi:hypothetical protein